MTVEPEPEDRPEGLETRQSPAPMPIEHDRPDWLVGADDVLESTRDAEEQRPSVPAPRPLAPPQAGPTGVVSGGKPERPKGWSGAASSIPKLTMVPSRDVPTAPERPDDEVEETDAADDLDLDARTPLDGPEPVSENRRESPPAQLRRLEEPWYLVWGEALATNRKVQGVALLAVALIGGVMFFPRHREPGASLGAILRNPERFEGRPVVVRGEVLEAFDIGSGHVFHLRQGQDTVVVFSPSRRPRMRERVEVIGTVSTGYLDGEPRVALFESPK